MAKKDVSLKIEPLSKWKDDEHLITSAKEIEFILRYIAEKGARVALYYGGAQDFILTTLLGIDNESMWLEQSQNDTDNKHITDSNRLVFVSSHLDIKVQFTAFQASSVIYQGYPAFHLPLPASLYRLQRREHYRLMIPSSAPLHCVIAAGKPSAKQSHEFSIIDISCGGVGIICMETGTELILGKFYPDCRIDLPYVGTIKGTIEVKTLTLVASASGHTYKHAGCEFKNLDGQSIVLLQRYVTNMQGVKTKNLGDQRISTTANA